MLLTEGFIQEICILFISKQLSLLCKLQLATTVLFCVALSQHIYLIVKMAGEHKLEVYSWDPTCRFIPR